VISGWVICPTFSSSVMPASWVVGGTRPCIDA
jgi:hypothetical protein